MVADIEERLGKVYTTQEVANYLDVDYKLVLKLIKTQELKAFKVGRNYRIHEENLKKYINKET